jgi:protein-S-isoprenylcysteine O-methyltransferase Ste14
MKGQQTLSRRYCASPNTVKTIYNTKATAGIIVEKSMSIDGILPYFSRFFTAADAIIGIGMLCIILSLGGFAELLLADLSQLRGRRIAAAPLAVVGYLMVAAGLVAQIIRWGPPVGAPNRWLGVGVCLPFLLLLLYSVFLEIPLHRRLNRAPRGTLCRRGSYGLCRHPGLLWFVLMHLSLNLAWRDWSFLLISLVIVTGDLALVVMQDRHLFPRLFPGYQEYRRVVPFLIPNLRRS